MNDKTLVRRMASRWRATEPLRRAALATLDGAEPDRADLRAACREVSCPSAERWRELTVALWTVGHADLSHLSVERREELATYARAVLTTDHPSDLPMDSVGRQARLSAAGGAAASVAVMFALGTPEGGDLARRMTVALLAGAMVFGLTTMALLVTLRALLVTLRALLVTLRALVVPWLVWADRYRLSAARRVAANALGRWRDVRSAGALAVAADGAATSRLAAVALSALMTVLGAAKPEDYGLLTRRDQFAVCKRCLMFPGLRDEPSTVRALRAIGILCGGPAAGIVRFVAEDWASEAVRAAAAGILPVLEARDRAERAERTLLRPSEAGVGAAALLRPGAAAENTTTLLRAAGSAEVAQEQLLRSTEDAAEVRGSRG